jgi:hypothetical protein
MGKEAKRQKPEARRGEGILRMLLLASGFWLVASFLHAEVIDRIVAVVDGHIITLSDLRQERERRVRLRERPIEQDHALARELIDSYLIERQIGEYPSIDVSDEEVEADLRDAGGFENGPSGPLRDAVRKRIRIQKFLDIKFSEAIRPTEAQIRKYYDEVFVPAARARGLKDVPPLSDVEMAKAVRDNVIQEALDREVTAWLETLRRRSNIEVFE